MVAFSQFLLQLTVREGRVRADRRSAYVGPLMRSAICVWVNLCASTWIPEGLGDYKTGEIAAVLNRC